MTRLLTLLILTGCFPFPAWSGFYMCTHDGQISYQQTPCVQAKTTGEGKVGRQVAKSQANLEGTWEYTTNLNARQVAARAQSNGQPLAQGIHATLSAAGELTFNANHIYRDHGKMTVIVQDHDLTIPLRFSYREHVDGHTLTRAVQRFQLHPLNNGARDTLRDKPLLRIALSRKVGAVESSRVGELTTASLRLQAKNDGSLQLRRRSTR